MKTPSNQTYTPSSEKFAGLEGLLTIRAMVAADIPAALDLWQNTDGVGLTIEETPEMLVSFLERNPSISSAAFLEGRLVGAVLGGHDGRRGYLYHLAVATEHRRQGLARSLVDRTTRQLGAVGLLRATLLVYATNHEGQSFWRHLGWHMRLDLMPMQLPMRPDSPQ
jgi:putative acetyltransferase